MDGLRRHPLLTIVASAVLALGAAAGIAAAAGFDDVRRALIWPDGRWLGVAAGAEILAYLGYLVSYRAALRAKDGPRMPFSLAARLVAVGFGPFAPGGGFALDMRAMHALDGDRRSARQRVLNLGTLEIALLAPTATVAAAFLVITASRVSPGITLPWIIGPPVGIALALWLGSPQRHARLGAGGGLLRHWLCEALNAISILQDILRRPHHHGDAVVGGMVWWLGDMVCLYAAVRAFGGGLSAAALVVAYATGYALSRRSLPLAGAAVTEAFLAYALFLVGEPFAVALVGVLAYRFFNFVLPMVPAVAARPGVRRLVEAGPPHA